MSGSEAAEGLAAANVAPEHVDRPVATGPLDDVLGGAALSGAGDKAGAQRMRREALAPSACEENMAHSRCVQTAVEQPALETRQEFIGKERRSWWPLGKMAQRREGRTKETGVKASPNGAERTREVAQASPLAAKPKWLN